MNAERSLLPLLSLLLVGPACGGGGDDVAAYCEMTREADAQNAPGAEELTEEEQLEALEELRDAAPDEIADDVSLIVDTVIEARDSDDLSLYEGEEFQAATERASAFYEENCSEEG